MNCVDWCPAHCKLQTQFAKLLKDKIKWAEYSKPYTSNLYLEEYSLYSSRMWQVSCIFLLTETKSGSFFAVFKHTTTNLKNNKWSKLKMCTVGFHTFCWSPSSKTLLSIEVSPICILVSSFLIVCFKMSSCKLIYGRWRGGSTAGFVPPAAKVFFSYRFHNLRNAHISECKIMRQKEWWMAVRVFKYTSKIPTDKIYEKNVRGLYKLLVWS